jgi:hypothetical protein
VCWGRFIASKCVERSKHGQCVTASQKPNATLVAGIRSWNQSGRRVKRGENGIMIFAPMVDSSAGKEDEQTANVLRSPNADLPLAL